ncbi:MAG: zinc-dependent alcohol dehydrogenase family protein [Thiotrichales bacterium]|nr:zinc-dependent alcohol dehydrogenase family protein [Thiotrichales bacterium]
MPSCVPGRILIEVQACAVCRTDLHIYDGDLPDPGLPRILGHEIIGKVIEVGAGVEGISVGERVGVPWLGLTCGDCEFCRNGQENLCDEARFTGYHIDGGYAEYTLAHPQFVLPVPADADPIAIAPFMCAGLIGYRSYRMAGKAQRIGIYGFGAAAHIICQIAVQQGREIFAFTRAGDQSAQDFALSLGAVWAGAADTPAPEGLDAAIIYAPVGELVPAALRSVKKGGVVVCAGIHMSDIPAFPYAILWGERRIQSVANLTRKDGEEFIQLMQILNIKTGVTTYALEQANQALEDLRAGRLSGAAVLDMRKVND